MISASGALSGSYDYSEVANSVLIAMVASYAALDLAARVTAAKGGIRLAWLSGGAIAMGLGIWLSSRPRSRCMWRAARKWVPLRP
jgi:methyl-accepting chemotaxis protein PixJ